MKRPDRPSWPGTVVCIASGPSLTAEDVEKVRAAGHPVIVTNTTFRLAPWADVLFGMDSKWWKEYHKEVDSVFTGRKLSYASGTNYGAEALSLSTWFPRPLNSGAGAIALAMAGGARRIVLLGFDCQKGERMHWHPDHPKPLGNGASIKKWPGYFADVAKNARRQSIEILNASRSTALTCFPRVELEAAL